ncbi:unnamed protein product [Lota lota]
MALSQNRSLNSGEVTRKNSGVDIQPAWLYDRQSSAPGAIAFLNLSLESQELWALSIEKKGMLFPCHPLVAPPSSLP